MLQVPNRISNPFDLSLVDHTVHFDSSSLYRVLRRSGLSVKLLSEEWIVKELTVLARYGNEMPPPVSMQTSAAAQVARLEQMKKLCRNTATLGSWEIFGTSNVACWVKEAAGVRPDFFLNEDDAKQGQRIDGVEILMPDQVPEGANVLMAMAPIAAERVINRLTALPV